jgi:hypothetical protein
MTNICQECGSRPAQGNHFLCYTCKRAEESRDAEAVDMKASRDFKFEMRDVERTISFGRRD